MVRRIKLRSSDDELFEVEEGVAFQSDFIKNMVEDTGSGVPIPLPNVSGKILAKIIEYCKFHVNVKDPSSSAITAATSSSSSASSSSAAAAAANDGGEGSASGPSDDDVKAFDGDFVKTDQQTLFDLILVCFPFLCLFPFLLTPSLLVVDLSHLTFI